MKRHELEGLKENLVGIAKAARGSKLIYAIVKNSDIIDHEVKLLKAMAPSTEKLDEYERRRHELCAEHSGKDEAGQVRTKPGATPESKEYDIQDMPKFTVALAELRKEYNDDIKIYNDKMADHSKYMNEESSIKLHKLMYSVYDKEQEALPYYTVNGVQVSDRLNAEQLMKIWPIIEDDNDPK